MAGYLRILDYQRFPDVMRIDVERNPEASLTCCRCAIAIAWFPCARALRLALITGLLMAKRPREFGAYFISANSSGNYTIIRHEGRQNPHHNVNNCRFPPASRHSGRASSTIVGKESTPRKDNPEAILIGFVCAAETQNHGVKKMSAAS
jgi:hypothetical protein